MPDPGAVDLIRRSLEEDLSAEQAASVFFEALDEFGGLPKSHEELIRMVGGSLKEAIVRRLGDLESRVLVDKLLAELGAPDAGDVPAANAAEVRDEEATRAVPTGTHPVTVGVISAGSNFCERLSTVLGRERVQAFRTGRPAALHTQATPNAAIVVIDATDFPPVDAKELVRELRKLPLSTARVLWGSSLPYGQTIARATRPDDPTLILLPLGEGIDPLLDLIRSRQIL